MKEFLEAIEKNPELKSRIEALKDNKDITADDIIAIAKEYGFELSESDFKPDNGELSDDELAAVSAAGGCGCAFAGSGGGDSLDCVCFFGGLGNLEVDGDKLWNEGGCVCFAAGVGATNRS